MSKKISSQQIAFFLFELERADAKRQKMALQDLCSLLRKGQFLQVEDRDRLETNINGLVYRDGQDLKVVRWCLNALARLGRLNNSKPYVEAVLRKYRGDPEIEAAGVAALCFMHRSSIEDIEVLTEIDPIVWKLAALQNTDPGKIDLSGMKIDIDKADPAVLRLALITVGLNRDIENLFHPRHSNNEFVRHLGQHSDDIVQQYSVWAVIENRRLVFDDLGVSLDRVEKLRSNVQSKVYQLVAERDPDHRRRLTLVAQGSVADAVEAREGLAKGVRASFFDGLEGVTLDWFDQETHARVRGHLAEHFARFSNNCGPYEHKVMQIYEAEPQLRERLRLGAEGTPIFSRLHAVREPDLFAGIHEQPDFGLALGGVPRKRLPRLTVLTVSATPWGESRIWIEKEDRSIRDRIKAVQNPKRELNFLLRMATRTSDILTNVLNSEAEVFHFSGHGNSDGLVFETDEGLAKVVSGEVIAEFLKSIGRTLKCVVFNACFSDRLANEVASVVQTMIGCSADIDDEAAITFSSAFYVALASGQDYQQSFALAVADVRASHSREEADKYVIRYH